MDHAAFAQHQIEYLHGQIRFMDTKAGFLAVAGASIAQFTLTTGVAPTGGAPWLTWVFSAAAVLAFTGAAMAFVVIVPRLRHRHERA